MRQSRLHPNQLTSEHAREACLRWLSVRSRSRQELSQRLRQQGFPDDVIEAALIRLESAGLVNDAALAESEARAAAGQGLGRRAAAVRLAKRGIARSSSEAALDAQMPGDESEACLALARRHAGKYAGLAKPVGRRRLAGFLARRGFGSEDVLAAVEQVLPGDE